MLVKELVLNSLESFEKYRIQYSYCQGKVKELIMNQDIYERVADDEIDYFYIDIDEHKKPYISLKLKFKRR